MIDAKSVGTTSKKLLDAPKKGFEWDVLIQNLSANNVYIGEDKGVTASIGLKMIPSTGDFSDEHYQKGLFLIADGAASDLRYRAVLKNIQTQEVIS